NIESQTVLPEKVIIFYSLEPWHLDNGWKEVPQINSFLKVELRCVPNVGSCRKYIFTLQEYINQEKQILLIDDDRIWREDVFERLLNAMYSDKLGLVTTRGWTNYRIVKNALVFNQ